ncbi:MAG TPA: molybdopterin-binding protein [Candidatus Binatia bacterium]|jgi:DMSO/TMAO reductase YedYZ molybdopterin-dependent catalytic subunit
MKKQIPDLSRRKLLAATAGGAAIAALSGCEKLANALQGNKNFVALLDSAEGLTRDVERLLTGRDKLAQEFSERDISRFFKPNGNPPPITIDYAEDARNGWTKWKLEISGLVKQPGAYPLAALKTLPARTQVTRHDCVEGWSAIAKWKGVPLRAIMRAVQPVPGARYVVFHCMDTDDQGTTYYESIDLRDADHPQTILAYEMNDRPLPTEHGAPLRLRVENQLGYKHAKYIRRIELVSDLKQIQQGRGGYWEDQGYEWFAGI